MPEAYPFYVEWVRSLRRLDSGRIVFIVEGETDIRPSQEQ